MAKDKSKPSKETAPCPHVSLKRQNVGNQRWYKCLVCPQKFTATEWDGKVAVECTAPAPQPDIEQKYRRLLWESHAGGTHSMALYGDDGEMRCNHAACMIDFKREPIEQIEAKLWEMNLKRATAQVTPTRKIDGKFSTDGVHIFNTVSGEEIPEDEPVFLLRGRDHFAEPTICHYIELCARECNDLHLDGIRQTLGKFRNFSVEHKERMKQPGITKHLKLEGTSEQASPTPDKECPRCGSNSRQVYFGGCCGFCPDPWHSSAGTPKRSQR